jgi:ABC-type transport system involved in cytochrome bd biosynthesis fused ATPase/permease subunit
VVGVILARTLAHACLTVLSALFWLTSALFLALTALQAFRGDVLARPGVTLTGAVAFALLAIASRWLRGRIERWAQDLS